MPPEEQPARTTKATINTKGFATLKYALTGRIDRELNVTTERSLFYCVIIEYKGMSIPDIKLTVYFVLSMPLVT
jgi:hypothetical protein